MSTANQSLPSTYYSAYRNRFLQDQQQNGGHAINGEHRRVSNGSTYSSVSRLTSERTGLDMPVFDPGAPRRSPDTETANDSGFSDSGGQDSVGSHRLRQSKTGRQISRIIREVIQLMDLAEYFHRDVVLYPSRCEELRGELESKLKPFLIQLDEHLGSLQEAHRTLINFSKIEDNLEWIVEHYESIRMLRNLLGQANVEVIDHIEKELNITARGCIRPQKPIRLDPARVFDGVDARINRKLHSIRQQVAEIERQHTDKGKE